MKQFPLLVKATYILLFSFLAVVALVHAKVVLIPLIVAGFFAILYYPLCRRLEDKGMHRIPAALIGVLLLLIVFGFLVFLISKQIIAFADDIPRLKEALNARLTEIEGYINSKTSIRPEQQIDWIRTKVIDPVNAGLFSTSSAGSSFAIVAPIPFYMFFFLFFRDKLITFFEKITPENQHYKVTQIVSRMKDVVRSYLSGIIIVVVILSTILSIGLKLLGVPYALFLGVLSAFMNIIPYIGIFLACAISVVIAAAVKGSAGLILSVIALYLGTHLTEANVLTPNIVGSKVRVNPLMVFLALIIGEQVWGILGMILFVPMLGIVKVVLDNIEQLEPYGFLLGSEGAEAHSITWNSIMVRLGIRKKKEANGKDNMPTL